MNRIKNYPNAIKQAAIREEAVKRVFSGETASSVTRSLGLAPKTIYRWLNTANEHGMEALAPKPRTGRNRRLTAIEELKIFNIVMTNYPYQYDLDGSFWNKANIINLVESFYHKSISSASALRTFDRFGYSPRKQRLSLFNNLEQYKHWINNDYSVIKRDANNQRAEIFWLDVFAIRNEEILKSASQEVGQKIHSTNKKNIAMIFSVKGKFLCLPHDNIFKPYHMLRMIKTIAIHQSRPFIVITKPTHFSLNDSANHQKKMLNRFTTFYELPINYDKRISK